MKQMRIEIVQKQQAPVWAVMQRNCAEGAKLWANRIVVVQSLSHVRLLRSYGLQPSRFLCPWDFTGKNTGVDCCFLLQGIFLILGLSPSLLNWHSFPLSHQGSSNRVRREDWLQAAARTGQRFESKNTKILLLGQDTKEQIKQNDIKADS